MQLLHELKRRARHAIAPVLGIGIFGYFAYHAIEGDRGLFAFMRLKDQVAEAEQTQREIAAIRAELDHRVALMRPDHTDPDMLDERSRMMLNLAQPDEIVIFTNRQKSTVGTPVGVPLPPLR
ncbi:MAG: septum formation initiator family protein [Alphaproteobacteria bacterium]|nr:septum formation initiator family protein [Alphaproteobacteria bacterium]